REHVPIVLPPAVSRRPRPCRCHLSPPGFLALAKSTRCRSLAGNAALRFPGPHAHFERSGGESLSGRGCEAEDLAVSPGGPDRLARPDRPGCGTDGGGVARDAGVAEAVILLVFVRLQ